MLAAVVSMATDVPLDIWAAHNFNVYRFILSAAISCRTLPTLVYLIPVLTLFSYGNAPGLIITVIFVISIAVCLAYLGITSVLTSTIEMNEAFCSTKHPLKRPLLRKIQLPTTPLTIIEGLPNSSRYHCRY